MSPVRDKFDNMRNDPNRIDEEEVVFDSLVQRLKQVDSEAKPEFERVPAGEDPPDYWLTFRGVRFAVEITCIVTDQDYRARCERLYREVRDECRARGIAGNFAMTTMRRPDILSHRKPQHWEALVANCVAVVERMASTPGRQEVTILGGIGGNLSISKESDTGGLFEYLPCPMPKYDVDLKTELADLIWEAIKTKRDKLTKRGVLSAGPNVILGLYDAHNISYIPVAKQAFEMLQGFEWLHSVYWAASFTDRPNILYPNNPGRGGTFLYTKIEGWR
jgi:hypothetical protein